MNCFMCDEECLMQTEKYMDMPPCMVCVRGDNLADEVCRECLANEYVCHFEEAPDDRLQRL